MSQLRCRYLVAEQGVASTDYCASVEFGNEVFYGVGGVSLAGFAVSVDRGGREQAALTTPRPSRCRASSP